VIRKVKFNYKQSALEMKPSGFWYGIGDSWYQWCKSESPKWVGKHNYEVLINESKLLIIGRDMTMENLVEKYGVLSDFDKKAPTSLQDHLIKIDWPRIAKEYSGIEIPQYSWEFRRRWIWYYTWDVACGVIWSAEAFHGLRRCEVAHASNGSQEG
jgi:hypothetical protein